MNTLRIYQNFRESFGEPAARTLAQTLGGIVEELRNTFTKEDFRSLNGNGHRSVIEAAVNLDQSDCENAMEGIVADRGYHLTKAVMLAAEPGMRTYIPELTSITHRRWTDKNPSEKQAVYANRWRTKGNPGKQLSRLRSELTERSFADVCDTGGARRTWLHRVFRCDKPAPNVGRRTQSLDDDAGAVRHRGLNALRGLLAFAQLACSQCTRPISALEALLTALVGYGPNRARPIRR